MWLEVGLMSSKVKCKVRVFKFHTTRFLRQAFLSISKKFNTEENLMPHVNQQLKSDGFTVLQMMVEILHRYLQDN